MVVRDLKYVALIADDKIKSMTTSTSLQMSLFLRQPHLQWILDDNNNIIEPLLHQLSLNALSQQMHPKNGIDVKDIFLWAIEKNVSRSGLQTTFNWWYQTAIQLRGDQIESDLLLNNLKTNHPDLLQPLLENLNLTNNVWETSFAIKYAPDPQQVWDAHKSWPAFYKSNNALAWVKKEISHQGSCNLAIPDKVITKTMHGIMGHKPFELWQYGAYMSVLSQNKHTPQGAPSGTRYGFALALLTIESAIDLGCSPAASTLALDTARRYKGKELIQDMLTGLDYCMEKYETEGKNVNLNYCTAILNTIIPLAIKEGLANGQNASMMDQKITKSISDGRIDASIAYAWFETRINMARKIPVFIQRHAPLWPLALRAKLILLEKTHLHQPQKSEAQNTLNLIEHWHFESTSTCILLDNMTTTQWNALQDELDSNAHTCTVVALLKVPHPKIDAYKSSSRARIAVVAACLVFIDAADFKTEPESKILANAFKDHTKSIDSLSLPQPLFYFANCFPQYRATWQRLACEMTNVHPENESATSISARTKKNAKKIVNALASLMLGKLVDVQNMLLMRESLGSSITYEELVQLQFNPVDEFALPDTFDESMFANSTLSL